MRVYGSIQIEMIANAPEEIRDLFSRRIKLVTPLLRAWKGTLKVENAVDFSGSIHQVTMILERGRFTSPWKHIPADEFQDVLPQRAALSTALHKQNNQTALFVAGDDQQAIYRFSGVQMPLIIAFHENFGKNRRCDLDTTYHSNNHVGEMANRSIQQNLGQLKKPLNSLTSGDKRAVTLLDESQLDVLLGKFLGYVKPKECTLILTRYHHTRPASLEETTTRWSKSQINFMTTHASRG